MFCFKVVLIQPEIPSNTGNIGRTCVATNSELHLVGPLGFQISDRQLKRAGLDYWSKLNYKVYESWEDWAKTYLPSSKVWFFSTKGQNSLYHSRFQAGDTFIFGRETKGLGEKILHKYRNQTVFIPQKETVRSLNLSNAVAIVLFEALRHTGAFKT